MHLSPVRRIAGKSLARDEEKPMKYKEAVAARTFLKRYGSETKLVKEAR